MRATLTISEGCAVKEPICSQLVLKPFPTPRPVPTTSSWATIATMIARHAQRFQK